VLTPKSTRRSEVDVEARAERLRRAAHPLPYPHLYVHIAKTAGTSLAEAVKISYGRRSVAHFWYVPTPEEARRGLGKRVIFGHLPYGFHQWLTETNVPDRYTYVTFLRDPVARVLSHYHYHRTRVEDVNHQRAKERDLVTWVREVSFGSNAMTAFLAGTGMWWNADAELSSPQGSSGTDKKSPRRVTEADFEAARANLLTFGFVGLTERFEDSLVLMREFLGLRSVRPAHENTGGGERPTVTATELEAIRLANRWDLELYEIAKRLFAAQVEAFGGEQRLAEERRRPPGMRDRLWTMIYRGGSRATRAFRRLRR
jgi:hypothetical protein